MTTVYKYTRERKELFQPRDNVGTGTNGHELAVSKSRLGIGKVVSNCDNELPPEQEGQKQLLTKDGVWLIYRRIFMLVLLRIASVSSTGDPPSPVSRCSLAGMLLVVQLLG